MRTIPSWPELELTPVDVVDDGERLATFEDALIGDRFAVANRLPGALRESDWHD